MTLEKFYLCMLCACSEVFYLASEDHGHLEYVCSCGVTISGPHLPYGLIIKKERGSPIFSQNPAEGGWGRGVENVFLCCVYYLNNT